MITSFANDIANELFDEGPIEGDLTDITDNDSDRIDNDVDDKIEVISF